MWIILCYLCLVFVMLSRLFIAALWSPAEKGLISLLLFVMFNCVFVTFPSGILGQVWYLIESIPDICRLSYFATVGWKSLFECFFFYLQAGVRSLLTKCDIAFIDDYQNRGS